MLAVWLLRQLIQMQMGHNVGALAMCLCFHKKNGKGILTNAMLTADANGWL